MANIISFNGNSAVPQPSQVKEQSGHKLVDRTTIKGVTHRYWEAQKYKVELTFTALSQADYTYLAGYFLFRGNAVTYANSTSGVIFTGYPTVAEDTYIMGASLLRDMTVTLVQK